MKKQLLFSISIILLVSCSAKRQVEQAVNSGDYDHAITTALDKLRTNKDKKRKYDYVLMLQDAYNKVVERDLSSIKHLKKDNNPELSQNIFDLYNKLNNRQEAIKPILPLTIDGKNIPFKFNDYSNDIIKAKAKLSAFLYEKGLRLLNSEDKYVVREAYNTFNYLNDINPNYNGNTQELLATAHDKGTHFVLVNINNLTQQIIPQQLEADLLNFNTYGLNQFWTVYHANKLENITYDFAMQLQLKQINIFPERIKERELIKEKEVIDGYRYKKDEKGNVEKDSLGNDIKIDKIITVKARYNEFIQTKESEILAEVIYTDLKTHQTIDNFPLDSGYIFENIFARYRGDKRALDKEELQLTNNQRIPFPSSEQMIFDTGEDLKLKLKNIIINQEF
ncbi:hypothetical protein PK35_08915 [Tamlana nanhaiensis]|uniref:Lipoprotein n=1 Tax=Neotamlana nanhaiensis TaxID=1382798 RepID=A0A0D7W1R4_9FLAO|nr:hypothetical protein [Tamlana nanhaiensis]KJD33075.1 hypothetical protein PK35_08915 [Tamlana nanhaiensis]